MKKYFAVFITFIGFLLLSNQETLANSNFKEEDLLSQIQFYDNEGNEIQPYTLAELDEMFDFYPLTPSTMITPFASTLNYGPYSFKSHFWVGPQSSYGTAFYNPIDMYFTVLNEAKPFTIKVYNDNGGYLGSLADSVALPGGWSGTVHSSFLATLPRKKSYRIKFENNAGSDVWNKVDKVTVFYN